MSNLLELSTEMLREAGYAVERETLDEHECLVFENSIVFGFLFTYESSPDLASRWSDDSDRMIRKYQFHLRRAGQKAWNTYVVLLAEGAGPLQSQVSIGAIEEDLVGTRKIARSNITNLDDVRSALLPLLPIQSAPKLDAVDMAGELRQRTTELPTLVVDAFLSNIDEHQMLQVMEEL